MQVREAMTRDVKLVNPDQPLHEAARMMADCDLGSLPVGDNDRLVGMVTDRDITVRGVAAGKSANAPVKEVMSREVKYCFEDDDLDDVAENMGDIQLHRLVVLDHDKKLVGILALADLANGEGAHSAGHALSGITARSGDSASRSPSGRN